MFGRLLIMLSTAAVFFFAVTTSLAVAANPNAGGLVKYLTSGGDLLLLGAYLWSLVGGALTLRLMVEVITGK